MVAAAIEHERLLLVDEYGVHTSLLAPIYGYAPTEMSAYVFRCRGTGARTRRYFRA